MAEAMQGPQSRGGWKRFAAVMGALFLAACETVVPRGRPVEGPVTPPPTTRPAPIPALPQDDTRNRVALLVPMTGPNARVGQSLANATTLALLDTKSESVRITTYDTATGAAAATQRAIAEGNRLILGPLLAEDVRAAAPIARRANVPVVSFSNDTTVAGNGVFVMGYTPAQSIERVVSYARSQGVTDFAGLMPGGVYGERASTSFLRAVEDQKGQVVSLQSYDARGASLAGAITRLAAGSPYQAVLIADASATAARAAPLIRKGPSRSARILGTELWNTDTGLGGNAALNGAWFASVSNGLYRQYATKYRARFGAAPYRLSSLGYDSVLLTVRIARDWRPGTNFPAGRLTGSDGFSGIDGAFRFARDGVAERALEVQEVRGGSLVTVSPAPRSFGN